MGVQSIGMPVRREEDSRLLRGKGCYVDDVRGLNEAHGYVLRSPHAHARIAGLDVRRARGGLRCARCLWASEVIGRPVRWIAERS
jgi:CO/xanthine dehydrogenase Mo-binding subunit